MRLLIEMSLHRARVPWIPRNRNSIEGRCKSLGDFSLFPFQSRLSLYWGPDFHSLSLPHCCFSIFFFFQPFLPFKSSEPYSSSSSSPISPSSSSPSSPLTSLAVLSLPFLFFDSISDPRVPFSPLPFPLSAPLLPASWLRVLDVALDV